MSTFLLYITVFLGGGVLVIVNSPNFVGYGHWTALIWAAFYLSSLRLLRKFSRGPETGAMESCIVQPPPPSHPPPPPSCVQYMYLTLEQNTLYTTQSIIASKFILSIISIGRFSK